MSTSTRELVGHHRGHRGARGAAGGAVLAVLLAMAAPILASSPAAAASAVPTCFGQFPTRIAQPGVITQGTPFNDVILGTPGPDIINGNGGNDRICSLAGNDRVDGGLGSDAVDAGLGNDLVVARVGNDTVIGNAGADTVSYAGNVAGVRVSLATLVAQNTVGAGIDTISSTENLTGGNGSDVLSGNGLANVIVAGPGNDRVDGAGGNDRVDAGTGNDLVVARVGNDTVIGNVGNDTVSYAGNVAGVRVSLATLVAQNTVGAGIDTISSTENLTGGNGSDVLSGNGLANVIVAGPGNDRVDGAGGNDRVDAGTGNDLVVARVGDDRVNGSAGTDTVSYAGNPGQVRVSLATALAQNTVGAGIDTITAFENLTGGNGNDILTGNNGPNQIAGGPGFDRCNGLLGFDSATSCELQVNIP